MKTPPITNSITPKQARHYITTFAKHIIPGTEYVEFPSGKIYFNNMTDEEAIKVAIGLMELETEAMREKMNVQ